MKSRRISEEKNIIRRIKLFAEQCIHNTNGELLAPLEEEVTGIGPDASNNLSEEFVQERRYRCRYAPYVQQLYRSDALYLEWCDQWHYLSSYYPY